jgi:hypothetical protein
MKRYPRILFFVDGPTPTEDQMKAAAEYGPGVSFRNARLIKEDAPLEDCDGVAGEAIPPMYADAFPSADDEKAMDEHMEKHDPNKPEMHRNAPASKYEEMSDEEKEAAVAAAQQRGGRRPAMNERLSGLKNQAGTDRVEHPPKKDEWKEPGDQPAPSGAQPAPAPKAKPAPAPTPTPTPAPKA